MSNPPWSTIAAERGALATDLAALPAGAWDTPSLCPGWSVRDVVAHMCGTAQMTPLRFILGVVRHGGLQPMLDARIAENRGGSPEETLALFRSLQGSTGSPPGPGVAWLGKVLVHAEDVRRPLGIEHAYPNDALVQVADFYAGSNLVVGSKQRIAGLQLVATDTDWSHGTGEHVRYAVQAEQRGFDFEVSSDHYFPWLASQGHAPYAWSVLGAVAHATEKVELMTYVTCPTIRYHPAVVAQKAATLSLLSDGRFTLGLGSGENLNEHVVGEGWPSVAVRQDMLAEALHIIRELQSGELVTWEGQYFRVDSARLWDTPEGGTPIAVACGGEQAVQRFAPLADHLVATEPDGDLVRAWNATKGATKIGASARAIGQIPVSWDPKSERTAIERAHDQFRWFAGGWAVNPDLPTTHAFHGASQFVRPEDVAAQIPCGPDLDAIVEAVKPYWENGFTDIALVQIGDELQERFLEEAAEPLLEKLRAASA